MTKKVVDFFNLKNLLQLFSSLQDGLPYSESVQWNQLKVPNTREKVVKMRFKEWTWCCNKSLANPPPSATKILCVALT